MINKCVVVLVSLCAVACSRLPEATDDQLPEMPPAKMEMETPPVVAPAEPTDPTPGTPVMPEPEQMMPTEIPAADLCAKLAEASCSMRETCCTAGINANDCRDVVRQACATGVEPNLANGQYVYDGKLALECVKQMKAIAPACLTLDIASPSPCSAMLQRVGVKKLGESCAETGARCETGLVCWRDIAKRTAICGKPLELGKECDEDGDCEWNAYCDDEAGFVCTAKKQIGESCFGAWNCFSGDCDATTKLCVSPQAQFCSYTPKE